SVQVLSKDDGTETANLERAAACVNACAGLNPSAVPGLVEAVEDKIRLGHEEGCTGPYKSQSIEIKCNCGITKLSTALAAAKKVEGE
ncbi:hypothetical protein KAR91_68530, partial [Candidatus Pacearchaeota archaeon]|nr:hypothetical protein [Candidatus Pacearchaeota archaeon]